MAATYNKTAYANLKTGDVVIITEQKNDDVYAASNDQGTAKPPVATAVTVADDAITTDATNILWTVEKDGDNISFLAGETYLYCTSTNNGVRVGTNANKVFSIDATSGYLYNNATSRYIGVYNGADWRCYTSVNSNITGQTLGFYVLAQEQGGEGGDDPQPATRTIYLNGGGSSLWNQADAVFFAHAWGGTGVDVKMTLVEGDVYSVAIPSDNTSLLFVRMAPGSEAINWDTKWNQSADQTIPADKDLFTMTDWSNGTWSVYGETPEPPTPVEAAYYLVGTMNNWQAAEDYKFAAAETEGEFILHTTLAVDDEIKVIKVEGETTTWYPAVGGNYVVDAAHAGEKDIYFRPAGNEAWAEFGGYIWMGENQPAPVADFTQPFTLKFNGTGESGKDNSAAFAADVAAIFDAASAPYVASVETATKVYAGRPIADDNSSVKFGTSSAQGSLSFTLAQAIEVDSIIVNATQYGNNAAKITVNGTEFDLTAGNKVPQDCKITPEGEVSSITIAQSGTERIYLRNVRVYPKTQGGDPVVVPAKFYVTGNAALVGQDKEWNPSAIKSEADTLELNLEADIDYVLKVTVNGTWEGENNVKGYNELTEKTEGLLDLSDDHNIGFKLNEAGVVKVIYKAAAEEQPEVFKLIGDFYVAPKVAYYLIGDSAFVVDAGATADKAWTPDAIPSFKDTTVLNLKAGQDYIMRLSLNGTWENHRDFRHLTDTAAGLIELPDEFGNHSIGFQLAEAGQVTVIYIPAAEEQPEVFKLIGNFYVAPAPDPTVSVKGSMNNWAEEIPFVLSDDKTYASLTVENIGADEYEFKFIINGEWRSNGYTYHRGFPGAAGITENNKANMVFVADQDGEYTFYWYFANDSAAIVYPEYIEPAKEYYAKYAPAWEWTKLTEAEGLWLTDTIVYKGIGININDKAADEDNLFYSNEEIEGALPIAGPEIDVNDTIRFSFNPADSVVTAIMIAEYVAPDPTASVRLEIMDWNETPFILAADKQSASLTIEDIHKGNYAFKMFINGEWRSNAGTISRENPTAIVAGNEEGNMTLKADIDGIYTFTWFFANDSLVALFPEKPVVPMTEIRLVPGVWNVDGAKFAAVTWNEGEVMEDGVVSDWFVGTDTVVGNIPAAADSIGFARFNGEAAAPSIEDQSIIWNHTDKMLIDKETMIYTITGWPEEGKDYCPGYWGAPYVPVLENGFYLVGNKYNWTPAAERLFTANPETEGEYFLAEVTLEESDSIKVVKVVNDEITDWYPNGDNYVVDAAHAGVKDIYFNPTYQEAWGNNIYIEANAAPFACDWDNIAWLGGSNDQIKVCKESEAVSVINVQKPGWAAEKGIYMTFPSAAWGAISLEEGSYVTEGAGLLVYLSALTQEYNEISIVCQDVEYIITIYNAANAPKPAFYLVANFNEWTAAEAYKFALNPNNDAEYVLTATLAEKDSLKVIRVMEGEATIWYPADADNYVVDAAHAGEKDIYFRPDYQGGEDWYAQCIYVAENAPQGCDWDHIDFIGSAVPELADQFKLCKEGQYPNVINIQNSFGTEAGIYVTFPSAAFGEISMTEGTYAIQGAGMLLYCSAFTDVETEVSIVCDGNPIIFTVYNAEGSAPVVDPTVSVKGSMNDWAEEIPFVLSDDKTYASLTVENISAGNYEFKFIINGEWRSNGYRYHRGFPGAAGITENNEANMTFEADIDGEYTFYWYFANDSAAIVYPAKPEPVLANGYYLVGSMNEWTPAAENLFALNPDNEFEYQLAINLDVNTEIKVVYVENDAIVTWYPAEGENYVIDDHHNGATTVYFRPDGQGGEDWFAGCIYIVPTSTVDITNVDANAPAVKILRDGQILIIKGEKMYNAQGQIVK